MSNDIKILANGEEIENYDPSPDGVNVLVHQQGINVQVEGNVKEINGFTTVDTMRNMNQKQWEWISTGDIFRLGWNYIWDHGGQGSQMPSEADVFKIPETIDELLQRDIGIIHVAGMIVQVVECVFEGKTPFIRNPETHLHPSVERVIMQGIRLVGGMAKATMEPQAPDAHIFTETPQLVAKDIPGIQPEWAELVKYLPETNGMPKKSIWENIGKDITFRFAGEPEMHVGTIKQFDCHKMTVQLEYEGVGGIWQTGEFHVDKIAQVKFRKAEGE